jgi:hypothetical protein
MQYFADRGPWLPHLDRAKWWKLAIFCKKVDIRGPIQKKRSLFEGALQDEQSVHNLFVFMMKSFLMWSQAL